jgi:phage replication-related protein YjqB (UPF0714/DUF867 family)
MAKRDLSKLSEEELVELNNELEGKRADAVTAIKEDQLEIQAEISRKQRRRRLENLSSEERAELVAMIDEEGDK